MVKNSNMLYLDVTTPDMDGNFPLINKKNEVVGKVSQVNYMKHPEKYLNDKIMAITSTGYRDKKKGKPKPKRCKCK